MQSAAEYIERVAALSGQIVVYNYDSTSIGPPFDDKSQSNGIE